MAKEIFATIGVDIDAVAGWIGLYGGANSPSDIQRGQTLQVKLTLGDPSPAVLIPNGGFYNDTGGAFVFVVSVLVLAGTLFPSSHLRRDRPHATRGHTPPHS